MNTPDNNLNQMSKKLSEGLAHGFGRLENPYRLRRVILGLGIFCVILFIIDLFYHRHAYFGFEASRGFYPIVGFFAFACIVILAGQLRRLIKRPEDYYGSSATSAEAYPDVDLQRLNSQAGMDAVEQTSDSPETDSAVSSQLSSNEESSK